MTGIKKLTVFARKVVFTRGSLLDLPAPRLTQKFKTLPPGGNGEDGKDGPDGADGRETIAYKLYKISEKLHS